MKKNLSYFFATILMVSMFLTGVKLDAQAAGSDTIVYVTKTGECYHTGNCSSLKKSKIETTLGEVSNSYKACSKCNPPKLDSTTSTTNTKKAKASDAVKQSTTNTKTKASDAVKQSTSTTDKVEQIVWLSATGSKYHSKNNCGSMDPNKATQVTETEAQNKGKSKCSKCW